MAAAPLLSPRPRSRDAELAKWTWRGRACSTLWYSASAIASTLTRTAFAVEAESAAPAHVLAACPSPLGAQLGCEATPWDELLALRALADEYGVALHCDGARLLEIAPWYGARRSVEPPASR